MGGQGGPGSRSRGMSAGYHTRAAAAAPALLRAAAAAPVDSDDEDYSPAASSDEGLGQRQYSGSAAASSQLESPFLTKQRELHAHAHARRTHPHLLAMQSQFSNPAAPDVYARAADALTNRAAGGGGDRRSPAAVAAAAASAHPAVLAQLQARQARQDAASQMGPPPPALTLGPRPMALASAAGAAADGWTVGNRRVRFLACYSRPDHRSLPDVEACSMKHGPHVSHQTWHIVMRLFDTIICWSGVAGILNWPPLICAVIITQRAGPRPGLEQLCCRRRCRV